MAASTPNSCCNLANGKHRCYDPLCSGNNVLYDGLKKLAAHVKRRQHYDHVHRLGAAAIGRRTAALGVARVTKAIAGDAESPDGGASPTFADDALARLQAARQKAAEAKKPDNTRSRSNTRDAQTDDIDGDDARRRRKRARRALTSLSTVRDEDEAHAAHGDDDDDNGTSVSDNDDSDESGDDEQRRATADSEIIALRQKQSNNRKKRRSVDRSPRARSSVWTTAAVASWVPDGAVPCAVCPASIKVSGGSSSNVKAHWKSHHGDVYAQVETANGKDEKFKAVETAVKRAKRGSMNSFVRPAAALTDRQINRDLLRRVCGVLMVARDQTPLHLLNSDALTAFVHACGGRVDNSKTPYLTILPDVYDAAADIIREQTNIARVGSITYDGWSARLGMPIAGMTFNFVDKDWTLQCFPLTFFDTGATGKTSDDHAAIMRAAVRENSRIGDNVMIFAGTSDNEASVALGVAKFVGFDSAVRCLCHTMALAVNAATQTSEVATCLLQRIADIATFLNERKEVARKLASAQLRAGVSPDRIKRFHRPDGTRWHIKLHALLDWLDLKKYLVDLLPEHLRIADMFEAAIVDIVTVYMEVRRTARAVEADRWVTGSRAARLVSDLLDTLQLLSLEANTLSSERNLLLARLSRGRVASQASFDKETATTRKKLLVTRDGRLLASAIASEIETRCGHLVDAVSIETALVDMETVHDDEEAKKQLRQAKEATLLHTAALFDVNECGLEFIESDARESYKETLVDALVSQLPDIYGGEMDEGVNYKAAFMQIQKLMRDDLIKFGRREPDEALAWWRNMSNVTASELQQRKISSVLHFLEPARAYLSIQASSASAERLFGDAGFQEGIRRQHTDPSMAEMLLTIRYLVMQRTDPSVVQRLGAAQSGSLSVRATLITNLATEIAEKIQLPPEN